jgi:tRNA (guanine26-N2/guanine27-N2)-dimethyltransferase
MNNMITSEGDVLIEVPFTDDSSCIPSSSAGVFYNPEMELNRDITISAVAGFIKDHGLDAKAFSYADVMSASGIRGIRMAAEVGPRCCLNDWKPDAFELIQKNILLNDLENICTSSRQNANTLMHRKFFDIVDLDPFGSPAPFLDAAARSARRLLCITATDTAPLCGAHLKSGIRKYAAVPLNTEYHREMGARILLGAAVRTLARYDKGVRVLLTHATRHYVRVYLEIIKGVVSADDTMEKMGFINHCLNCGYRSWKFGLATQLGSICPHCKGTLQPAGPLWLGSIQERDFCESVLVELETRKPGRWEQAVKIIEFCYNEIDVVTYYDQHWLCKKNKISPGPIDELIEALVSEGFYASRTHFSGTGFKTDAGLVQINILLRELDNKRLTNR